MPAVVAAAVVTGQTVAGTDSAFVAAGVMLDKVVDLLLIFGAEVSDHGVGFTDDVVCVSGFQLSDSRSCGAFTVVTIKHLLEMGQVGSPGL